MKNFFKFQTILRIVGIIAMAAVIGFSMTSCGGDDDDGGGSDGKEIPSAYQNTLWKNSQEGVKINKTDYSHYPLENEASGSTFNVTEIIENTEFWVLSGPSEDGWTVNCLYLKKDGLAIFVWPSSYDASYEPKDYDWDSMTKQ